MSAAAPLLIAGRELRSRLILGTGGFDNHEILAAALAASGTEMCTVALRRLDPAARGSILDVLDELSAGLRPSTPDNAPAIGPGAIRGLHWATGHYRHGVLLAPITAELAVNALAGEELRDLAAPFSPSRFANLAVEA